MKKSLSILLSFTLFAMTFLLYPQPEVYADDTPISDYSMDFTEQSVQNWGGTSVDVTQDCSGTGWSWKVSSLTLTLTDFNFTSNYQKVDGSDIYVRAIILPSDSTVELNGTNTVTAVADSTANVSAIFSDGGYTYIKGAGTLNAIAGDDITKSVQCAAISANALEINDTCTVNATSGSSSSDSNGIKVASKTTINGAKVTSIASKSNSTRSYGVRGSVYITAGEFTAKGSILAVLSSFGFSNYTNGALVKASTDYDGSNEVDYNSSDKNTYRYIHVEKEKIDTYDKLCTAVQNAGNGIITIDADIEVTDTINIISYTVIDLNGKTISSNTAQSIFKIDERTNLVVQDSGTGGKILGNEVTPIKMTQGNFRLKGGTVEAKGDTSSAISLDSQNNGSVTIQGGTVTSEVTGNNGTIYVTNCPYSASSFISVNPDGNVKNTATTGEKYDLYFNNYKYTSTNVSSYYSNTSDNVLKVYPTPIFTVSFLLNYDGCGEKTDLVTDQDGKVTAFPSDSERDGYTFDGWFTEATDGTRVTSDTVFTSDSNVYAHWVVKAPVTPPVTPPATPPANSKPSGTITTDSTPLISSTDKVLDIIEGSLAGETVKVNASQEINVSKEILAKLKDSKSTLEINGNWYTWVIDGKTIKGAVDIDLTCTKKTDSKSGDILGFKISHEGDFPFEAKLKVELPGYIKEGTEVYLYKIVDGKRIYQSSAKTSGYSATFQRNSASEYVVSTDKPTELSAGEGAFENAIPLQVAQNGIPFLVISIILISAMIVHKKKVR